jgi:hypothetical protein
MRLVVLLAQISLAGTPVLSSIEVWLGTDGTSSSYSQATAAQNVQRNSKLELVFSEAIQFTDAAGRYFTTQAVAQTATQYTSASSELTISGSSLLLNDARDANFFMEHVGYGVTMPADFLESSSTSQNPTVGIEWAFSTGDFVPPAIISALPLNGDGGLKVETTNYLSFTFSEAVVCGSATMTIRDMFGRATPASETFSCNARCVTDGPDATISTSFLDPCVRYEVTFSTGCFTDKSDNANPATAIITEQWMFHTSCISGFSPSAGGTEVDFMDSITLTFVEALVAGANHFQLTSSIPSPVTEDYIIGASNEITFAADGMSVTFAKTGTSPILYLCPPAPAATNTREYCKGVTWTVTIADFVLRRATAVDYLFGGNLISEVNVPAQSGPGAGFTYTFTMRVDDNDAPMVTFANVHAVEQDVIRIEMRLDEPGTVYCKAFSTSINSATTTDIGTTDSATTGSLSNAGYYPASMDLTGLTTETTYNIFCYSIDDEIPTANVMQVADIQATLHTITTWDGTPPTITCTSAGTAPGEITATVITDEDGEAWCTVVPTGSIAPHIWEVRAYGFKDTIYGGAGSGVAIPITTWAEAGKTRSVLPRTK